MSHQNKSFAEASRQVADLMAAVGQGVDAYEDETHPPAPTSFEAALASVEAAEQHADPVFTPDPAVIQGLEQIEDQQDLGEAMRHTQGDGPDAPHAEAVSQVAPDDKGDDWEFMCATGLDEMEESLRPEAVEPERFSFHSVVECSGSLEPIWEAFERANHTSLDVDGRKLEIVGKRGAYSIRDEVAGVWYLQAGPEEARGALGLEEGDIFIWVIPLDVDDPASAKELGYIHNGYVFVARSEEG